VRLPRAQQHFAVVVNTALWMDTFSGASAPLRARMLSMAKPGAMSALYAVPSNHHGKLLPCAFINAMQLSVRLPLSLLAGIHTCSCGKRLDAYGDHLLTCVRFLEKTKPGHDLIEGVFMRMARAAGHKISHDSSRPHTGHRAYSPHWRTDFTSLFGSKDHTHIICDVTCPSVVTASALHVTASDPDALSLAHAADKRRTYGAVAPHVVLPLVVDDSGGLGKEAWQFLLECRDKAAGRVAVGDFGDLNWSCSSFTSYYLQSISLASVRGWGHFFMVASSMLRGAA
jgi:hypothetical protein